MHTVESLYAKYRIKDLSSACCLTEKEVVETLLMTALPLPEDPLRLPAILARRRQTLGELENNCGLQYEALVIMRVLEIRRNDPVQLNILLTTLADRRYLTQAPRASELPEPRTVFLKIPDLTA